MGNKSFVREFDGLELSQLIQYLEKSPLEFIPSEIYSTKTATKFVDENKRLSEFRSFKDPEIFQIVSTILAEMTKKDEANTAAPQTLCLKNIPYI